MKQKAMRTFLAVVIVLTLATVACTGGGSLDVGRRLTPTAVANPYGAQLELLTTAQETREAKR